MKDTPMRVSCEIREKVEEVTGKKPTTSIVTYYIKKHNHFPEIKEDVAILLFEQLKSKRGRPIK
jgi:N-acetyl-gamma-glutamylphosphate reductase